MKRKTELTLPLPYNGFATERNISTKRIKSKEQRQRGPRMFRAREIDSVGTKASKMCEVRAKLVKERLKSTERREVGTEQLLIEMNP